MQRCCERPIAAGYAGPVAPLAAAPPDGIIARLNASVKAIDPRNSVPLDNYYRSADALLNLVSGHGSAAVVACCCLLTHDCPCCKQAREYRTQKSQEQLYVTLLRYTRQG